MKIILKFLFFGAAITYSSTATDQSNESIDIAIIGGGIAGLTAAYNLNNSGISCCLYEAKDHVGGRTKTHYFNESQYYELGGTQIDCDHKSVIELAKNLDVKLDKILYGEGEIFVTHNGVRLSNEQLIKILEDSKKVFDKFREYKEERDLIFNYSTKIYRFENILNAMNELSSQEAKEFWETFIKIEFGIEADLLPITSARWLYEKASNYCQLLKTKNTPEGSFELINAAKMDVAGTYSYRVKGGMSKLVNALKDKSTTTNFEFNQTLKFLSKDESGYHLKFETKNVTAQNVIMAIPFSTLREVKFGENFGLSENHTNAIQNLNYSTVSKIGLPVTGEFETLAYFNIDQNQQFFSWHGHNAVTIMVGGEAGKNLTENQAEVLQKNAKKNLLQTYPRIGEFGNCHIKNWAKDPFAKGSWSMSSRDFNYTYSPSESFPKLCQYAEPIHENTFIFAGEHTICGDARAHIEGAVQSGEIAAKIILAKRNNSQKN